MARTRNHSVLSARSPVVVSVRDWSTATRIVAMAVPLWVVPTVGSRPRLPTRVKFNISQVLSSDWTPERWKGEEQMWLAEPELGSHRLPARSRATHACAAATHAGSRSDAQT